jgi:4-amino-4-deoxy-L-arabinose transferase-like glycosyltransferase
MKSFVNAVSRNWRWTVFSIFTIALLIRVAFILTLQDGFYFPDSISYSGAAVKLINNGELGETYDRPPGYPVFLAAIYLLFGESILAIRLVESLLGAILAILIAMVGRRIGGQVVGGLAGVLWSIYPIGVFIAGLVYPTGLFTALLASGVLCLLPASGQRLTLPRIFSAGIIWGLAALTIPIVLGTMVVISLWLIYWWRANGLLLVAGLFLGAALTVVPWTVRDFYVHGRIVAVEPRVVQYLPDISITEQEVRDNKFQAIVRHPTAFAKHFFRELLHFWQPYPDRIKMGNSAYRDQQHEKDHRIVKETIFTTNNLTKAVSLLSTGPLFLLAITGTVMMGLQAKERCNLTLMWAIILSFALGYSIFYSQMRYRIPIEPYVTILSAYGLSMMWSSAAKHLRRRSFVVDEVSTRPLHSAQNSTSHT